MRKSYCLLVFMLSMSSAFAQPHVLTNENRQNLNEFEILADRNYSFERIITDSSLTFIKDSSLYNFNENKAYWIKFSVTNPLPYSNEYYLAGFPFFDNTVYFYNSEEKKWQNSSFGLGRANGIRLPGIVPVSISGNTVNNFYIKMNLVKLSGSKEKTKAHFSLIKADYVNKKEQQKFIIWIATLIIIVILFLYNFYTYYVFKDKAFLYYLRILLGGVLYITSINYYLNVLLPFRFYQALLRTEGIYHFDLNGLFNEVAILLVITGFIQFTRHYLQTKVILPRWDKVLKYSARVFTIFSSFITLTTITGIWFTHGLVSLPENIFIVAIILLIILVGIIAYKRKYAFGKYFLIANILPLIFVLSVAVYFIISPNSHEGGAMLPNLAVAALAFTFAVALATRINILKQDLGNEQLQAQTLLNNLNKAEQNNNEKEIHLKEIHHRVKNNLQIINGLLFMQFKDNNDEKMKAQLKQSQERIKSMALVHNKLYESDSMVHVYIKEYIKDLAGEILKTNTPTGKSIQLNIEENEAVNLSLNTSVSLGLILNELITNACKYAFAGKENGHINIAINKQGTGYQLIVKDNGSGLADDFHQKNSMGLRLVSNLSKQLGGEAKFENNSGTVVTVNFVDAVAA